MHPFQPRTWEFRPARGIYASIPAQDLGVQAGQGDLCIHSSPGLGSSGRPGGFMHPFQPRTWEFRPARGIYAPIPAQDLGVQASQGDLCIHSSPGLGSSGRPGGFMHPFQPRTWEFRPARGIYASIPAQDLGVQAGQGDLCTHSSPGLGSSGRPGGFMHPFQPRTWEFRPARGIYAPFQPRTVQY